MATTNNTNDNTHEQLTPPSGAPSVNPWLAEVAAADQVITALGDAFPPAKERRRSPRLQYQVRARLELVDEGGQVIDSVAARNGSGAAVSTTVHTRDLDPSGSGFVTREDLSGHDRGVLCLPAPDGNVRRIACHIRRAREVGGGWYEGVAQFDTEQPVFSLTRIRAKFEA